MYTLKNQGASRCHRTTFLSKWFHNESLTSEEPLFHKSFFVVKEGSSDYKKVRKRWFFDWMVLCGTKNGSSMAWVSNPAPGELPSWRFQLQPQSNTPDPANQGVQGYLIITDRCVAAGWNWSLQDGSSSGAGLEIPVLWHRLKNLLSTFIFKSVSSIVVCQYRLFNAFHQSFTYINIY